MERIKLDIFAQGSNGATVRASANKWRFQDTMMGEQYITATIFSERPIDWAVGDYCVFRGETFTLNYIPSLTQKANTGEVGDAYTYEGIKFDSRLEELTRVLMLDITPTTGDYIAALGTNHTGSSRFPLYCGETTANGDTLTPVCALAAKIQANLDRAFPNAGWHIYVDTETMYTTATGRTELVTHTEDKELSFDNTTVAAALQEVHNTFDLDYCVRGRNVYIGYTLKNLTSDDDSETFAFGYGKGYPTVEDMGKALFQIKRIADSQQKIVTRLRALGSTKNMPYRYYNKKYGAVNTELSQSLFPTNLQLPNTFNAPEDKAVANASRDSVFGINPASGLPYVRHVLGDTNDAYIDKNDDAESCIEGIREDSVRFDGSNGDLPEIYPTIEEVTYGDLRGNSIPDMDGGTGSTSYQGTTIHPNDERVDEILAVGYLDGLSLVDDVNIGDGILPENDNISTGVSKTSIIERTSLQYTTGQSHGDFIPALDNSLSVDVEGPQKVLVEFSNVQPGSYYLAPTLDAVHFRVMLSQRNVDEASANVGFILRVKKRAAGGSTYTTVGTYVSEAEEMFAGDPWQEIELPAIPDAVNQNDAQVSELTITEASDIALFLSPYMSDVVTNGAFSMQYMVGNSLGNTSYESEYTLSDINSVNPTKETFHLFLKDMGFNIEATFNGDTPMLAMKSGMCVGREFEIGENVQTATVDGVKGYLLTLNRAKDDSLGVYFPNSTYTIEAGDRFVLLGISMPAYVEMAEVRLLRAATDYLADNSETVFTYRPYIDDIYLQRNYDNMVKAGTPEDSIFWRLYAGYKFSFIARFASGDENIEDELLTSEITIEQVSIQMGDGLTPKVEITLNDDLQQSTIQKLTTSVDRIYNGSLFSNGSGGSTQNTALLNALLQSEGGRMFLSRLHDDEANGTLTFNGQIIARNVLRVKDSATFGSFMPGFMGSGARIDDGGNGEFETINVRGALSAAEFVFNMVSAQDGEAIYSMGHGTILEVEEIDNYSGTITLKLDGDEWATISAGDICRGMFNTLGDTELYDSTVVDGTEDANGFRQRKGFFTSYFRITSVDVNAKGSCKASYILQTDNNNNVVTSHPCPLMKFSVYGNAASNKKSRQNSIYITALGIAPRIVFFSGVNTWAITPANVKIVIGNLQDMVVVEELSSEEYNEATGTKWTDSIGGVTHYYHYKTLSGDAGFYCEDNIYLGGIINQFKSAALDAVTSSLGSLGQAWVLTSQDQFVVDCDASGNALSTTSLTLDAQLFYGGSLCELATGNTGGVLNCYFSYGGQQLAPSDFLESNTKARRTFTFTSGNAVSSGTIKVVLKGTYNSTSYTASRSVAIIANKQGSSGRGISSITRYYLTSASSTGVTTSTIGWDTTYVEPSDSHPYLWTYTHYVYTNGETYDTPTEIMRVWRPRVLPRLRNWADGVQYQSGSIGEQYIDIVQHLGLYFRCLQTHISGYANEPTGNSAYWTQASNFDFIASDLMLADKAIINNLVATSIETAQEGPRVVMSGNKIEFYGDLDFPSIVLTTNSDKVGVLRFYDKDGNIAYDLGPSSITDTISEEDSSYTTFHYSAGLQENSTIGSIANIGASVTGLSTSQCTAYYKFKEGYKKINNLWKYNVSENSFPSSWNMLLLIDDYSDSALKNKTTNRQEFIIPDGWYARSANVRENNSDIINGVGYTTQIFNIVGGKIVRVVDIYFDPNDTGMYYDAFGGHHKYIGDMFRSTTIPITPDRY